jgi:hypothetical protein
MHKMKIGLFEKHLIKWQKIEELGVYLKSNKSLFFQQMWKQPEKGIVSNGKNQIMLWVQQFAF